MARELTSASNMAAITLNQGSWSDAVYLKNSQISSTTTSRGTGAAHSLSTQSQQDEAKLAQIRQIAQYLNIQIPKKFDVSK